MTDQKPTGVFIRLPLSDEQRMVANEAPYKSDRKGSALEASILAIGTPVVGEELKPIAYVNAERLKWKIATDNDFVLSFSGAPNFGKGTLNLVDGIVLYTDHLAAVAQRDAEIARLRDALRGITYTAHDLPEFMRVEMMLKEAEKALKGPKA